MFKTALRKRIIFVLVNDNSQNYIWLFFSIGVYIHSSGSFVGDHAVKLIGWDRNGNWLLINSFGPKWGYNGTFLMPQDYVKSNCDFGYAIIAPKLVDTEDLVSNAFALRFNCKLYMFYSILNICLKFYLYRNEIIL